MSPIPSTGTGLRRALGTAVALSAALTVCGGETPTGTQNPLPVLTSLTPDPVVLGQASASVTVGGSGFVNGSQVRVDGSDRVTTFMGAQELTFTLAAADLAQGGTHEVTVVSPPPGGGTSGTAELTIGYPVPALAAVSPLSADAGSPAITLTVTGSGFVDGASTVRWGTSGLPTTFVDPTTLSAEVPSNRLANADFVDVSVVNPGPGGGSSAPISFAVEHAMPVLTSVSPGTITSGVDTRVSLVGEHFVGTSVLVWDGVEYPAQVVSASILYVDMPGAVFGAAGPGTITVRTPAPGGGTSNGLDVAIVDPPPVARGFTPASADAGGPTFILQVHGENFSPQSEVRWNGAAKVTTFIDTATLEVPITATEIATPGTGMVSVHEPGGGSSTVVGFPIIVPMPTVSDLSITLRTTDLVAAPAGNVVYATVPASAPSYANEVVALDPVTGNVLWDTPAGSDPQRVVVSADGAYLYVMLGGASSVSRIDVAAMAKDLDIQLPSGRRAEDIVVLPESPTSIAVSLRNTCCSPRHEGVVVFDGSAQRPLSTQGHTGSNRIEPSSSPDRIYGYNNETTEFGFRRILVRSDGLLQDGVFGGVVTGFGNDIAFDGGLIFTARGRVVEPESRTVLGTIPGTGRMRPDVANGRVHFLEGGVMTAYHFATFTSLGSVTVPGTTGLTVLVRFGTDGMAFGGGDTVVFMRSPLVGS